MRGLHYFVFGGVLCRSIDTIALKKKTYAQQRTLCRGGACCNEGGRSTGVHAQDLSDFMAVHSFPSEVALAEKTENQLYNPGDLHRSGFLSVTGTLLQNSFILKQGLFLTAIAVVSGVVGWHFSDAHDMTYFEHLEDALHALIIFFMGLFISNVYGRWFDLFKGPFGSLWGAITGCSMYGRSYLRGPHKSKILLQNLRWGLLSHALLFKDGSAENDISDLVERHLCTPVEAEIIGHLDQSTPGASRSKLPWSWIAESFARADEQGWLYDGEHTLPMIHQKCAAATGGIGAIGGALNQKLPLPYVHLLTIMAKFNMGLMAMTRGMAIAAHVKYGLFGNDVSNLHGCLFLLIDLSRMVFLPLVYQGSFELHALMWNPFDGNSKDNPVRFPEIFYHWKILGESASILSDAYPGTESTAATVQ